MVESRLVLAVGVALSLLWGCAGEEESDGSDCPPEERCDGACVDTSSHPEHCGECGQRCGAEETCSAGLCVEFCSVAQERCAGACTDLLSDDANCGGCGLACPEGQRCADGVCGDGCGDGLRSCAGTCTDVNSDSENCGDCASPCEEGLTCVAGACRCPGEEELCEGGCVPTDDDPQHCGGCGIACAPGQECEDGECRCPGETELCDLSCVDPSADPLHCGSCDNDCTQLPNVDAVGCGPDGCIYSCLPGYGECGDERGCGTDLLIDEDNCGACDLRCGELDGVRESLGCSNGVCSIVCAEGRGDCDHDPSNGCETDTTLDEHCGACGRSCLELPGTTGGSCEAGTCTIAGCEEGWGDCDHDPLNGCETNLLTHSLHCGACGNTCETSCHEGACAVAVEVQASVDHTCARLNSGEVWCWGLNQKGMLGLPPGGTFDPKPHPVRVSGIDDAISIAVGEQFGCAALQDGTVACWGSNQQGQLGDGGTVEESYSPVAVSGLFDAVEVTAGSQHACARTAEGKVFCWGSNNYGQTSSTQLQDLLPVEVPDLEALRYLRAGGFHTCVIARTESFPDGTARCWGRGNMGQLGHGLFENSRLPVGPNMPFEGLSAGGQGTCARMKAENGGGGFCWGYNFFGQVGGNIPFTSDKHANPIGLHGISSAVTSIESGLNFNCAQTQDGNAYCWGTNTNQQFGMATDAFSNIAPVLTQPLADAELVQIGLGTNHGCGVNSEGEVLCWGRNDYGQLGDGTTDKAENPVPVQWGGGD